MCLTAYNASTYFAGPPPPCPPPPPNTTHPPAPGGCQFSVDKRGCDFMKINGEDVGLVAE